MTFEDTALAAMHLVAPGGTGLVARKVWFTLPDAYVALGSDIATKSAGEVRTVVEHRNLGENAQRLVVDGTEVTGESVIASARWAHLDGVGGYVFLDGSADLRAGVAMREGTWRRNSTNAATGTDVVRRRTYGSLSLSHGTGADAGGGYAYIVHPGADAAATAAASASPRVRVLRNDAVAQAIRHSGHVTAAAFWSAGAAGGIAVDRAACVIARTTPGMVRMSVSEPTQSGAALTIDVDDTRVARVKGTDAHRVDLVRRGDGIRLTVDTSGTAGGTIAFSLHR